MRIRHVASIHTLIRADAAVVADEYLSIRDATVHEFRDEDERGRYVALVRAWGLFAHHAQFSAAVGEGAVVCPVTAPVIPVCRDCGSDEVVRDASARRDVEAQDWTASGVYDSTTCEVCEAESDMLCRWVPADRVPATPIAGGAA